MADGLVLKGTPPPSFPLCTPNSVPEAALVWVASGLPCGQRLAPFVSDPPVLGAAGLPQPSPDAHVMLLLVVKGWCTLQCHRKTLLVA